VASAGHRRNREPSANHILRVFRAKTKTKSRREGLETIAGSSRAFRQLMLTRRPAQEK
jgi:hypothetical protein